MSPRSRLRRPLAASLVLAIGAGVVVTTATAASATPPFPIDDPFAGLTPGTTMPDGWARIGSSDAQARIVDDGAAGQWVRLTDNSTKSSGAVYSTVPYSATEGVSVEFDMRMFNDRDQGYADGMSVFLQDASVPLDRLGPLGGGLGYWGPESACSAGMPGGVLGVGFDRYGNFNRGTQNAVTLRGPAAGCYAALATTGNKGTGFLESRNATPANAPYRHVRLDILPSTGGKAHVQLSMSDKTAIDAEPGAMTKYFDTDIDIPNLPENLRLGFAGSTGDFTEHHEIRGVRASQPIDVDIAATVTTNAADVLPGDEVGVRIVATNRGPAAIGGAEQAVARLVSRLDALGLEDVRWSCVADGGAACAAGSGTGNVLVDWTGPSGSSVTVTATGKLRADAKHGTLSGTAETVTDFDTNRFDPMRAAVALDHSVADIDLSDNSAPLSITTGLEPAMMRDDSASTPQATTTTVDVLANDVIDRTGTDRSSVRLIADGVPGAVVRNEGKELEVPGDGTYRVLANGSLQFTPLATLIGPAHAITYQATSNGGQTATAKLTVTVTAGAVAASDDSDSTDQAQAVTLDVLANDTADASGFDRSSVRLDGAGGDGRTLRVDGEGAYVVGADGRVTFTPDAAFLGSTTSVRYRADTNAGQSVSAQLHVTVRPAAVGASDDSGTTDQGQPVRVDVLANDLADPSGFDPSTLRFGTAAARVGTVRADGDQLVVPKQGTYTIGADGTISFAPLDTFIGTADAVRYRVDTRAGQSVAADLRVTVTAAAVAAADDRGAAEQGEPVTLDVLANDSADPSGFDRSSLVLGSVQGADLSDDGKRLAVPGQGLWAVRGDGAIRFSPITSFIGETAPAVPYRVTTNAGQAVGATITVAVEAGAVAASDDLGSTGQARPGTVDVLANDSADPSGFDTASVALVGADADGGVTVAGEGRWTLTDDGLVAFAPVDTFIGRSTPVAYTASTNAGQTVRASVSFEVEAGALSAADDAATTAQAEPVEIDVLRNDEADPSGFDPASMTLSSTLRDAVRAGSRLTVPGQGTWDVIDGRVRFTPLAPLIGAADPIRYDVATRAGQHAGALVRATVTAAPVAGRDDVTTTMQGEPVEIDVLANDLADPSGFVPGSVRLPDAKDGNALVVDGQGRWTTDAAGRVRFEPLPTHIGTTRPVTYEAFTAAGQRVTATVRVDVAPAPVSADPDRATTAQAESVRIPVLDNDAADPSGFDLESIRLVGDGETSVGASNGATKLVVRGEGTYRVVDSEVEFTPEARLIGAATPIDYTVDTLAGQRTGSTISVDVTPAPVSASPDAATTIQHQSVSIHVLDNDEADPSGFDPATVALGDADTRDAEGRVDVPDEGTWSVEKDGAVTFAPVATFIGTATPMAYTASTIAGQSVSSDIAVTVDAVPVVVRADDVDLMQGTTVTWDVLANDDADPSGWDLESLGFVEDGTAVSDAEPVSELVTTFGTLRAKHGLIEFTPVPSFVGTSTKVTYSATTKAGQKGQGTLSFTAHAVGPRAADDHVRTSAGTAVRIDPTANDRPGVDGGSAIRPGTLRLLDESGVAVTARTLDAGTFRVHDGAVTFTPADGFTGKVPAVGYRVLDSAGAPGTAKIHVTVDPQALAFTGSESALVGIAAALSLILGGLLLAAVRLRRGRGGRGRHAA